MKNYQGWCRTDDAIAIRSKILYTDVAANLPRGLMPRTLIHQLGSLFMALALFTPFTACSAASALRDFTSDGWNYGRGYKALTDEEQQQAGEKLNTYAAQHPIGYCGERADK